MPAELYRLLPRQKTPAAVAARLERSALPTARGDPVPVLCHASPRPATAFERVHLDVWPPTLPKSPGAVSLLNGCVVWQREDEDADAFNQRAARIAAICECDDAVVYRRVW